MASDAMFLIHRSSMTFLDVNRRACLLLGFTRDELLKIAPMALTGHSREYHETLYDTLINGSYQPKTTEVTLHSKAGIPITFEMQRFAQLSEDGWIIVAIARDISEIKRAKAMVGQANADLARLAIELETVREQERTRLATKLHGDLAQLLAAMRINLSLMQQQLPASDACLQTLDSMDKLMVSSITSLRRILSELRPQSIADGELYQALHALAGAAGQRYCVKVEFLANEIDLLMDESRSTRIYNLVQEALGIIMPDTQLKHLVISCERLSGQLILAIYSTTGCSILNDDLVFSSRFANLNERVKLLMGAIQFSSTDSKTHRMTITMPADGE